jgi:hypothetical protein
MAEWVEVRKDLEQRLTMFPPPSDIADKDTLNALAEGLTTAMQQTIKSKIKLNKPSPHSKRWWNSDLDEMKPNVNRLRWRARKFRTILDHPSHAEYRSADREYGNAIEKAKIQHWSDYLENATSTDIWTANRYMKIPSDEIGKTRVPTLVTKDEQGHGHSARTNSDKADALAGSFFPKKPEESSVPKNFMYPQLLPNPLQVSIDQIRRQVMRLSPYKASGPDEIPNIFLQKTLDIIKEYLLALFRAVLSLGLYYNGWQEFTTVVLRKPGKPDYMVPKAYCPIALLCTMAKVLMAIVAEDMAQILELEELVPENHYGGRAGRKMTDAVHVLEDKIRSAWRMGKVAAVLFLDVEGAFPNAVTDRLIHNLQRRRIPEIYVRFVQMLLKD